MTHVRRSHSAVSSRWRASLALLVLTRGLALWLLGGAARATDAEQGKFLLESIRVVDASPSVENIVISQSLLKEGSPYDEGDLQDALARINRLPFVASAQFELVKGTHRGAYVLRITLDAQSPFFLQAISDISFYNQEVQLGHTGKAFFENTAGVGARSFVGKQGVLFAGLGTGQSTYGQIGFTQYGLFRTGAYVAADLQYAGSGNALILPFIADPSVSGWEVRESWAGRLAAGFPIAGNQSIRARYTRIQADVRRLEPVFPSPGQLEQVGKGRLSLDQVDMHWLYDTTDEAPLPTRGLFLATGAGFLAGETPETLQIVPGATPQSMRDRRRTRTLYLSLSATDYLPVTPRHTVLAGLEGYAGPAEVNGQGSEATFRIVGRLGHSAGLWSQEKTSRLGDLRLVTTLEYSYEKGPSAPPPDYERFERLRLASGLVLRNRWALLRLGLSYTVLDRGRR